MSKLSHALRRAAGLVFRDKPPISAEPEKAPPIVNAADAGESEPDDGEPVADDETHEPDTDAGAPEREADDRPKATRGNLPKDRARAAILAAAIHAATTPVERRLLLGEKSVAVVIRVPSAVWVNPMKTYFMGAAPMWETFARDGSSRSQDKSTIGNDLVADKLAAGKRVLGIAADIDNLLPSALLAAADLTIAIEPPTGAVVRDAMRRCLRGRLPAQIDDAVVVGLDIDDFVSAMRFGSTPAQALERLREAARRRHKRQGADSVPLLETAVEYGDARTWGLALARDIGDYRAGRLPWSHCDRGAVLHSDPGCGKSLLAASIAHACQVPLIRASVAELFADNSGDLGAVIKSQRAMFALAAAMAPCILFLDEIDAVPNRATLSSRGRDWWLPVINDLLLLLDAAVGGQREGVVVIGATNRIDDVDAALLRPGRLERSIEIARPDLAGTENVLRFQLRPDLQDVDITAVAQILEGSTPAEIMDVVRGARRSARHAKSELTVEHLRAQATGAADEAPAYLRRIAVHEAAHAVIGVIIRVGTLRRVRLQSRGTSAGHTLFRYRDDDLTTLSEIEGRATSILAASVAERLILGAASTGGGGDDKSDLGIATQMVALLHTSTCVTGNIFHRCAADDALPTVRADPQLRRAVEQHLRKLEERAENLVHRYREAIIAVADALQTARHLSGEAVISIIEQIAAGKTACSTVRGAPDAEEHDDDLGNAACR